MKKFFVPAVLVGVVGFVAFVSLFGCATVTSSNTPAPAPSGTTSIEVGSGGTATCTVNTKTGACSVVVVDQNKNPITSTNNLNIHNISIKVWTTTTATQSAAVGTLTYNGGSSGSPISYGLTLDRSSSMGSKSGTVNQSLEAAALAFINNTGATDQGCVINFSTSVYLSQNLTTDKGLLNYAVTGESVTRDLTDLYGSIITGVTTVAAGANSRKALIAMTDGENTTGSQTLTAAIAASVANKVPVYTVGLGTSVSDTVLQKMATDTSGLYYKAPTASDLTSLYNKISSALGSSWTIDWTSPVTFVTGTTYYILVTVTYDNGITNSVLFTVTV